MNSCPCVIFTVDYEVFGDGSGDIIHDLITPTASFVQVLDVYNIKATFYVEVGHLLFLKRVGRFSELGMIERQLLSLASEGHDLQLHIHPMWFFQGPDFVGPLLKDFSCYDLSMLPPDIMRGIVSESVQYLSSLVRKRILSYNVTSFRAGAWSLNNYHEAISILSEYGIKSSSTIAPGAVSRSGYGQFDFRRYADCSPFWVNGCDQNKKVLEIPILTSRSLLAVFKYFNLDGLRSRRIVSSRYKSKISTRQLSVFSKLRGLLGRFFYMADFNFLSASALLKIIINRELSPLDFGGCRPCVLIGHSKTSYFNDRLHFLFKSMDKECVDVKFMTISQFVEVAERGAS